MPPTNPIQPKGGVNHISVSYISPMVDLEAISGLDKPTGGTEWWTIDNTLKRWVITGNLSVTDEAYGPTWDGSLDVPTKNALFGAIEPLRGPVLNTPYGSAWAGVANKAPSQGATYDKIETLVSNTVFGAAWNDVIGTAPSMNAVYDKLISLPAINFTEGTYTPTVTIGVNISTAPSPSAFPHFYVRFANIVLVMGSVNMTAATSGYSSVTLSLPVPSNFTTGAECWGSGAAASGSIALPLTIQAHTSQDKALMGFTSSPAAGGAFMYVFGYRIV